MYQHRDREANPSEMRSGIFYRVPHCFQTHANLCTDASINMLHSIGNKPIASMSKNPRGSFEGKNYEGLNDFRSGHILLTTLPPESPEQQTERIKKEFTKILDENGPFILNIGLKFGGRHSIVVTGISENNIIYNDPLTGSNRTLTIEEIKEIHGRKSAPFLEVAIPEFLSEKQRQSIKEESLPKDIETIKEFKYKAHFTLKKMEKPTHALKEFLKDIVKRGNCSEEEKNKLNTFLNTHKNTENIVTMIRSLHEEFPKEMQSTKLNKCLESVFHYMNISANEEEILLAEAKIPEIEEISLAAVANPALTIKDRLNDLKTAGDLPNLDPVTLPKP